MSEIIWAETETGGRKDDKGKLRFDLLPAVPMQQVAKVFTIGAEKYAERNWEKGMLWGRIFAASMRHLWAWWSGESLDAEDGQPHLAHAIACLLFLLEYENKGTGTDDRVMMRQQAAEEIKL